MRDSNLRPSLLAVVVGFTVSVLGLILKGSFKGKEELIIFKNFVSEVK